MIYIKSDSTGLVDIRCARTGPSFDSFEVHAIHHPRVMLSPNQETGLPRRRDITWTPPALWRRKKLHAQKSHAQNPDLNPIALISAHHSPQYQGVNEATVHAHHAPPPRTPQSQIEVCSPSAFNIKTQKEKKVLKKKNSDTGNRTPSWRVTR